MCFKDKKSLVIEMNLVRQWWISSHSFPISLRFYFNHKRANLFDTFLNKCEGEIMEKEKEIQVIFLVVDCMEAIQTEKDEYWIDKVNFNKGKVL